MARVIRFGDAHAFERAATAMMGAAAATGFAAWALDLSFLTPGWSSGAAFALLGTGVGLAALPPSRRAHLGELAWLGAAAAGMAVAATSGVPFLVAAVLGTLLARSRGPWRLLGAVPAAAAVAGAQLVMTALPHLLPVGLPLWLVSVLAGGAFGLVASLALVPHHLAIDWDPLSEVTEPASESLPGEDELAARERTLSRLDQYQILFDRLRARAQGEVAAAEAPANAATEPKRPD